MSNLHLTLPLLAPVIAAFINLRWSARAEREAAMDSGDSPDGRAGAEGARPVNPFDAIEWRWPS